MVTEVDLICFIDRVRVRVCVTFFDFGVLFRWWVLDPLVRFGTLWDVLRLRVVVVPIIMMIITTSTDSTDAFDCRGHQRT